MSTLKKLVDEIILEQKEESLKLFYEVDVFLQEFKDAEKEPEDQAQPAAGTASPEEIKPEPIPTPTPNETPTPEEEKKEDFSEKGNLLTEAIIKIKTKGELVVPKDEAANIQTIQDLIDYLGDKNHNEQSTVEKILGKKGTRKSVKIITPEVQEIILILMGLGGDKQLKDIVDKGDKVIIDVDYGPEKLNSIGFKVNKNAGADAFSIMIKKDGKVLSGKFDQSMINKQILYYRNSLEG
jgi:chemotaxis response regulator CheB